MGIEEQIQIPVGVVIGPEPARGALDGAETGRGGDVLEAPAVVIVEQPRAVEQEIRIAIAVVVAPGQSCRTDPLGDRLDP